jgi:hypothetical protein
MNFLKQPSEEILPNSDMDEDQLSTASDFFDADYSFDEQESERRPPGLGYD